jgi:hypothetical protein
MDGEAGLLNRDQRLVCATGSLPWIARLSTIPRRSVLRFGRWGQMEPTLGHPVRLARSTFRWRGTVLSAVKTVTVSTLCCRLTVAVYSAIAFSKRVQPLLTVENH